MLWMSLSVIGLRFLRGSLRMSVRMPADCLVSCDQRVHSPLEVVMLPPRCLSSGSLADRECLCCGIVCGSASVLVPAPICRVQVALVHSKW